MSTTVLLILAFLLIAFGTDFVVGKRLSFNRALALVMITVFTCALVFAAGVKLGASIH